MNLTNALKVEDKELVFHIGKLTKRDVSIICEFNPIKKLSIIDMINDCDSVEKVYSVAAYDAESGGIALRLKANKTEFDLKASLEDILKTVIV